MKRIITILLGICLSSSILVGCGPSKTADVPVSSETEQTIEAFESKEGGFSVEFPGIPQHEVETAPSAVGDIDFNIFAIEEEHILYMVTYNDYPEEAIENSDVDQILLNAANGAVAGTNGKLLESNDITLGEYSGKKIKYEAEIEGMTITAHHIIFLVGNRLYQVNVTTDNEEGYTESINRFFDSFKFINQ